MRKNKYMLIAIITTIIYILLFNTLLDKEISSLINTKSLNELRHKQDIPVRNKGAFLRDYFNQQGDLQLYGSSELGSKVPQNPVNLYPFNDANYDISIYGVAHVQNLQHATMLGGIDSYKDNSKIAIVQSLQWFQEDNGISADEFLSAFSEVQFYQFMNNRKISLENKRYFCKRILELLESKNTQVEEVFYAKTYISDYVIERGLNFIIKPYYLLKEELLETRDKILVYKELKKQEEKNEISDIKKINFDEEYKKAEEQGSKLVTNNSFFAEDGYYDKYLKDIEGDLENKYINDNILNSREFEDFEFLLSVCKDLNIKPYIILMNVNGWYYDYTGIGVEERREFYSKLEKIAKDNGFDVLNLNNKEYEKYYLSDVMHLGWKGWLNVTEEMYKYFNEN
ncbi:MULTISPECIES: D-alanyl-lipoteichoic acid biosynthesis protein DltD [Clostridium]|jgi:D-alanine transfer protein|uniref:D-alanyl-lipoteichoic acid biosynthesis protein DltD n=1 Tax=Clostridium TaxID=1485 RepID=UPI0011589C09|nr:MULTISPECIES: D-alanyl-lipoteichoic acid biosynthesis protein DltD [Clostridium]MBS5308801.1 D-alanyl-lipoteichoic acid biosynthesis protein DltD [Clostridium sp.]MDB1941888.1 D-alanyl-lipoteichoic acid biosynthesis protein DltD [Clostridium tertium]MDU3351557.1 D-alanyl-lipoteichoic acid biosynthesis protein DltD [Clostridium sp.]MDU3409120.1 D-alanyl-lipoteichoic acid biosynthesis protein DltD [Clostridium sp.]